MKDFDEYDDEDADVLSIEDIKNMLSDEDGFEVEIRSPKKGVQVIYVLSEDPGRTRHLLKAEVLPDLGLDFIQPRKTKSTGFMLDIVQDGSDEVVPVRIVKGGQHQRGRKNELGFQNFVRRELKRNGGECHLHIEDDYGKTVDLDVVGVMDTANQRGKAKRSDTTLRLKDGSLYGISHKKTNACFVAKVKRVLADIRFSLEQKVRNWAKENGIEYDGRTYLSARITSREFIDLCWFGTDIAQGAAFIGDFEEMDSTNVHIQRIVENGDTDVLTSFPIYLIWKAVNRNFTMKMQGVCVRPMGTLIDDDLELPGINAPLSAGKRYLTGDEQTTRKRRKRRRPNRRLAAESWLMLERAEDMWDTIAWCAENHKMVWLKYETVDGEIISRRVAPYSYRTRRTKVRGKATYFYGQDFTPGEDSTIKCFLVDNCLQAKKSPTSFSPKFTVEIKQEIDRLEDQRREEERREKERKAKMRARQDDRQKERDAKDKTQDDMQNYKNTPERPKPEETRSDRPEPAKKVDVVKGKEIEELEQQPDMPKKPLPPPPEPEDGDEHQPPEPGPENDKEVTVDTKPPSGDKEDDTEDIQITDDEGNEIEQIDEDTEMNDYDMHGACHEWAWRNWTKGDKFFVLLEYDEDIESEALLHCGLFRNGLFIDAEVQSDDIDDILENFDYGDYEMQILTKDEFKDFCIDFGLPLKTK